MKRSGKLLGAVFVLMLVLLVVPKAQAASSKGYVYAGESSYTVSDGYTASHASANGYKVRIQNHKLQVRKGNSSWKTIASNRGMGTYFSTNGSTIYYTVQSGGRSTIYSISVSGKNKKVIKRYSGYINGVYRYGNLLFFNDGYNLKVMSYSLSTKKTKTIISNFRMEDAKKQYVVLKGWTTGGDAWIEPIYSYNMATGTRRTLTKTAEDYNIAVTSSRVYYVYWTKNVGYGKQQTFQVKSCKLNGTDYKTHTVKFKAIMISDLTSKYVKYQKDWSGNTYKLNLK